MSTNSSFCVVSEHVIISNQLPVNITMDNATINRITIIPFNSIYTNINNSEKE